jgi:hypothetical protein
MSEWLYQIRIKVSENISNDLRDMCQLNLSKKLKQIAKPICGPILLEACFL